MNAKAPGRRAAGRIMSQAPVLEMRRSSYRPGLMRGLRFGVEQLNQGCKKVPRKNAAHSLTTRHPPAALRWICAVLAAAACTPLAAQPAPDAPSLPSVTISARANPDPVEKSYRKMVRGMDLFDSERERYSPQGVLRFRLLPRRLETDMNSIAIEVTGTSVAFDVPVAPDHSFTLTRNLQAFDENAQVTPNRKRQTMTWRSDIRTPGLPPGTRRLGDLRLECRVGMQAGLVSEDLTLAGRLASALLDTPAYCERQAPQYLFFADRPLFGVTLVAGARRHILSIDKLYAGASDNPRLAGDLPECDCEVLVDRTYVLPLGDRSWPDDTRVEFEYMEDAP